jgi:TfoX/Sxy family transcriptional regulator of competence genes
MATEQRTAELIADLMAPAGEIRTRKMFGEYAVYLDDKVIAFICDDQLFLKPTEQGRDTIGTPDEAPAYPGSKLYFRIPEDTWEDNGWLSRLATITADALPTPKPKKPLKHNK